MTPTEIREALQGARTMLEDESNIVLQAKHFFEDQWANQLPVSKMTSYDRIARVCGAGAFLYSARTMDIENIEIVFSYRRFSMVTGGRDTAIGYMTRLIAKHKYGELLDLYDEAIAYWSAVEAGIVATTAHERSLVA